MTMTKNAVGNLIARYKTVLQNCSLLNTFGSLAAATVLAGAMVLGGATGAMAADEAAEGDTTYYVGESNKFIGGWDYYDLTVINATHGSSTTNIIATSGSFDEIIGGNHYKSSTATKTGSIGDTSVTVGSEVESVQYIIGGSKSNRAVYPDAVGAIFETGDTTVIINGGTEATLGMAIGGSYGKTGENQNGIMTMVTGDTSLTINGGNFEYAGSTTNVDVCVVGGSVAEIYNAITSGSVKVTDDSTSLTINGGTFANTVVGAGMAFNNLTSYTAEAIVTGTATTTISGGDFNNTAVSEGISGSPTTPSLVAGGYAYGVGTSTSVDATKLYISGDADFAGKVIAGGYAFGDGATSTVGSTYVYITGGTFNDNIVAGGFAQGDDTDTYAYANVTGDTYLEIAGNINMESFGGDIVGGGEASRGQANVYGDTTVIIGSGVTAVQGNVYGGGLVNGNTSSGDLTSEANVTGSTTVEIYGEILESVFGGGRARAASCDATANVGTDGNDDSTNVYIYSSATVNGVAGGGWAHGNSSSSGSVATANVYGNTYVTIDGTVNSFANSGTSEGIYAASDSSFTVAVVGGGVASGYTSNDNATADVYGNTYVVINEGAYIDGDVVGGGIVYVAKGSTSQKYGTADVDGDTNVTIYGGTITGDVYAGGYVDSSAAGSADVTGTATLTILGGTFGTEDIDGTGATYSALYGEKNSTFATVGTAILNIGSDTIAYTGTFAGFKSFDEVYISAGSDITLTGTTGGTNCTGSSISGYDSDSYAILSLGSGSSLTLDFGSTGANLSFDTYSKLVMDTSATLTSISSTTNTVVTTNIVVSSGAVLELTGAAGTVTIEEVTIQNARDDDYDDDGVTVTEIKSAWGLTSDEDFTYDSTDANSDYSTNSLVTSEYLTVSALSYNADTDVYSVTVVADSSAIASALGDSASAATSSFAVGAINSGNSEFASLIEKVLDADNGVEVLEGMTRGATVTGVVSGLGAVSGATVTNTSSRTTMAPRVKAHAASETSNWLAMNGDGAILPADGAKLAQGFGIWVMPMYSHTSADGFSMDSGSYGYDTDIFGATLGADYTFASDIRLGVAFSVGQGSSTSTGTANAENDFDYYGISVYGAKHFDQLGLSFDMGYTVSENETVQEVLGTNLYGDIDAAMFTLGLKAEYLVPLDGFNVTPYAGVRFNYYDIDSYDTKNATGATWYNNESSDSVLWEFPVGVVLDTTTQVGSWDFTPSLALGVKFAAGDLEIDQKNSASSGVFSSEVADEVTFQGGVGLGFAKDNCTLGLNYTLDLSENVESHGVSVNLRYEF